VWQHAAPDFFCQQNFIFTQDSEWALQNFLKSGTLGYGVEIFVTSCNTVVAGVAICGLAGVNSRHKVQLAEVVVPDLPSHVVIR
jgi:hypothetical protein